jgi:hypothetical protein
MSWVPYTGAHRLARIAARTTVTRVALAVALVALVLAAAAAARHPQLDKQPLLSPDAGGVVVLDLSASISADTYSRIGQELGRIVAGGGRYGLVVFSGTAYEAFPPGTPVSAFKPLIRYFKLPPEALAGEQVALPNNPWQSFSGGTQISSGLRLAREIELEDGAKDPSVILISDLADDQNDQGLLLDVLDAYKRDGIKIQVIALNPTQEDLDFFTRHTRGTKISQANTPGENPSAAEPARAAFPTWLVILAVAVAALLAANELRSARLRWGAGAGAREPA